MDIENILKKHLMWLRNEDGGERANLYDANLYDANLINANLRHADLRGANLTGANLSDTDLRDANLWGANLSDADLRGANLRGANLSSADLSDANLYGANMFCAKTDSPIIVFNGPQHQAIYCQGYVRIGCQYHSLKDWVEQYYTIGMEAGYSALEIETYGKFLKNLEKML